MRADFSNEVCSYYVSELILFCVNKANNVQDIDTTNYNW